MLIPHSILTALTGLLVAATSPAGRPAFRHEPLALATFDRAERWSGGEADGAHFREGNAGLRLSAPANRMQYASRELAFDAGATPWDLTLWVYTETPATIGRLVILIRSGGDDREDHVMWGWSGLRRGWNRLVVPSSKFFVFHYWAHQFTWKEARTIAFKLEANGNGPASVTLDDLRIEPAAIRDPRPPVVSHVNVTHIAPTRVTLNWTSHVPAAGIVNYGLTTDYDRTRAIATRQTFQEIALHGLRPNTRYHARIDATAADGSSGSSGDFVFTTAPANDPVPPDPGVPFELGLYSVNRRSDLKGLAGTPFTTVHSFQFSGCDASMTEAKAFLDRAQASGLKVMMGLGCNPADDRQSLPPIRAFKNHPALHGWFLSDEPEGHGVTPENLRAAYRIAKRADPAREQVIASFAFGTKDFPFRESFDRVDLVTLPIPFSPLRSVIPKMEKARVAGAPYHLVYQAFQADIDRWIGCCGGPTRYPSEAEIRALAFLGINHGTSGLTAFSHAALTDIPGSEWKWTELLSVTEELRRLRPLFASKEKPTVVVSAPSSAIDLGVRRLRGRDYVIAINTGPEPVRSSVVFAGAAGTSVRRITDGRALPLRSHRVADSWQPFEVHIYAATPER